MKTEEYVKAHGLDKIIPFTSAPLVEALYDPVLAPSEGEYPPEWEDLVFYHNICLERKATTVLEFGVGFSSIVLAHALERNQQKYGEFVKENIRRENPFEIHSVDDVKEYISKCETNFPKNLKQRFFPTHSSCSMATVNDRICTLYEKLPNVCPDLILLDAPGQHTPTGDIAGIHTRSTDRLPMAGDLIRLEHFLLPGTLIVVDGRSANARFLMANFQRNWEHTYLEDKDMHLIELRERPLGKLNEAQIKFCLGEQWLKSL